MDMTLAPPPAAAMLMSLPQHVKRTIALALPVMLARMSGAPILCFYLAVDRPWILRSWDAMMIPRPFSKVHVRWTKLIYVPANASDEQMNECHRQMQDSLERARHERLRTGEPEQVRRAPQGHVDPEQPVPEIVDGRREHGEEKDCAVDTWAAVANAANIRIEP